MAKLGLFAGFREEQIIEWAIENEEASFTSERVVGELFADGDRPIRSEVFTAYKVACRDLRRTQILKGLLHSKDVEVYVLNDGPELEEYLKEKNNVQDD